MGGRAKCILRKGEMLVGVGNWIYVVLVAMVIAAIVLVRAFSVPRGLPYRRRETLLTKAETRFYFALQNCVGDEWTIFAMVRIADVLSVDAAQNPGRGWFNRISNKHVDFVLCDPDSLRVVAAIELDDASHERQDRIERDEFVNAAFRSADLPLIRVPVQAKYETSDLRKRLNAVLPK